MLQDECESSRTYAAGRGEDDRIEQIVTDVRGGGKEKGLSICELQMLTDQARRDSVVQYASV